MNLDLQYIEHVLTFLQLGNSTKIIDATLGQFKKFKMASKMTSKTCFLSL